MFAISHLYPRMISQVVDPYTSRYLLIYYAAQSFNECLNVCSRYDVRTVDIIWLNYSNDGRGWYLHISILVFI